MTSQSQRRAQSGNVVAAAGEEKIAVRGALEIYDLFPEHTKEMAYCSCTWSDSLGGYYCDRVDGCRQPKTFTR